MASARDALERWLEAERDQLVLWLPVAIGAGVTLWFVLPTPLAWSTTLLIVGAAALAALAVGRGGRAGRALGVGALAVALGLSLVWWRANDAAGRVLSRPVITTFEARVETIEPLAARDLVRLRLATIRVADQPDRFGRTAVLPGHVRVNLAEADVPPGLTRGATIRLQARLMPPPQPAVPGAYDYARVAWFDEIGGTGRGFAPVTIVAPGDAPGAGLRDRLSRHIQARVEGSAGGIASALATGDQGAIAEEDAEAMRRSGLAHLLSVSGLHITAVVAATMLVVLRLLALSPWLALRFRLPLIAAAAGAAAAIGYTLLTGSQVPTIRSCVAALLVLTALAMGREAMTLRLVAAGAVVVLLLWPESLAGPSFQLSFAAITAIIALHEHPRIKAWFAPRDERWIAKIGRNLASLVLTGLAVEFSLMPIALFHFHKAGFYGAAANIIAIPWTTFIIMPLEALALLLDLVGLGAPLWWLTEGALNLLLWLARTTAGLPGAVAALPAMPDIAYALTVAGGLWIALWRTRWRRLGLAPLIAGIVWALMTPAPDLLVTGDGRHVAVRTARGGLALLRDRVGDYTSDMLAENGGVDGTPLLLADQPEARCNRDLCLAERKTGGRTWRILATRSAYLVPARELITACRGADIVISERRLPQGCAPRWLKLDRPTLAQTGGVAITLSSGKVTTVYRPGDRHPWRTPGVDINRSGATGRRAYPEREPGRGSNAGDHRPGSRDRVEPSHPRAGNI
jgi:competence protein ComEC